MIRTPLAVAVLLVLLAGVPNAQARFRGNHMIAACGPMVVQDAPLPKAVGYEIFPAECRAVVNSRLGLDASARCTMLIYARMTLSGRHPGEIKHISKRCLTLWERRLRPDPSPRLTRRGGRR